MPKLMKPPTDGRGATAGEGFYDGPTPKPGLYKGKVSYVGLGKIKSGDNAGNQKLVVMCQITEGPFKGAGVGKNLQLGKQGEGWVNQFLHSLTDGSEAQKKGIEEAFYGTGYVVDTDNEKNGLAPILKIGKKTNPVGIACNFVVTNRTAEQGDRKGEVFADISRFVSKRNDEEGEAAEDDSEEDFADALAAADDSEDDASDDDSASAGDDDVIVDSGDDDGDPWSV